ncbi:basic proline-rich protein-like [Betta splendens]|uniref:Basic proline-rich protein-like n=1 Tax=Betta splendens TaxID=158456 RepID=A0A6P7KVA6_BETSP|nr:basic proline-rich protein-like [Betta splendens]
MEMFVLILSASFSIMASAVPVRDALPPSLSQGGATQAPPIQPAEGQTPQAAALPSPVLEQAQAGVPRQPGPQGGPDLLPFLQQYTWSPIGGTAAMMPLQPGVQESLPVNQPALPLPLPVPQQPLVFPPYGYFPLFLSPYTNQLFSPYSFPVRFEPPLPQTPAAPAPNSPLLPAEASPVAAPSGDAPQPVLQNGQIMYMLQQPGSAPLGSLSSEELEIAAKLSQLGAYRPTVLQPVQQAAGLANPDQRGPAPTDGAPPAAGPLAQRPAGAGPRPGTSRVPAGSEKAAQATVQAPVQAKVQRSQGNCGHQQQ